MIDHNQQALPASHLTPELRKVRSKIIKGLVQLAGAEPVRTVTGPGNPPGLTPKERRELVSTALEELKEALIALETAINPPSGATPGASTTPSVATQDDARTTVEDLLAEVAGLDPDNPKDAKRLEGIPAEAQEPVSRLLNKWCPVPKIFVAVHGIGDQFQNETVQSVAFRVCDYLGVPAALPLGRFHGPGATVTGTFLPEDGRDPPMDCGFAEIYWANVPRVPAADKHILEEPRKWARNMVQRLRLDEARRMAPPGGHAIAPPETPKERAAWKKARHDDERLGELLEEMIEGVTVANRLTFLADKAGLFKFDLNNLLNDYLNDVQVVTEFEDYRKELLGIFGEVFEKIHRYFDRSEIYIVAHSEGTVVTFMGLLQGLAGRKKWTRMVRGLMTIGSPLNKHVRFWPELFDQFDRTRADDPSVKIPWKNYYDYGDPIGFDLQPTRDWLATAGPGQSKKWGDFFEFDRVDDIGFTRYYFPGAAHNDYWNDPEVFGHFLQEVVDKPGGNKPLVLKAASEEPYGRPRSIGLAYLTSWVLPYALAASLLFLACYLLYKAVRGCLDPAGSRSETPVEILRNVLGLSGLIAAMTFLARIPIVARDPSPLKRWGWRALALVLAAGASLGYPFLMSPRNRGSIERFLTGDVSISHPLSLPFSLDYDGLLLVAVAACVLLSLVRGLRPVLSTLLPVVLAVLAVRHSLRHLSGSPPDPWDPLSWHALGVVLVAWSIGLSAWYATWRYPGVGTKPLVHTGGLLVLLIIITQIAIHPGPTADRTSPELRVARAADRVAGAGASPEQGPIWPIFLAGSAFLYLWWLAIITFDLTVVWHIYIRFSGAQKIVSERLKKIDRDKHPRPA